MPAGAIQSPISGSSMLPTLAPGDAAGAEKYQGGPIHDGSTYVFHRDSYGVVIKRVSWTDAGGYRRCRADSGEAFGFASPVGARLRRRATFVRQRRTPEA